MQNIQRATLNVQLPRVAEALFPPWALEVERRMLKVELTLPRTGIGKHAESKDTI
jgi:hypothetical protein